MATAPECAEKRRSLNEASKRFKTAENAEQFLRARSAQAAITLKYGIRISVHIRQPDLREAHE
jgi:hypothetical protein